MKGEDNLKKIIISLIILGILITGLFVFNKKDQKTTKIKIGEVTHPMLPEHHIEWIILETKKGFQIKYLEAGDAPEAKFELVDDEAVAAYEYCNLHGLWKKDLI